MTMGVSSYSNKPRRGKVRWRGPSWPRLSIPLRLPALKAEGLRAALHASRPWMRTAAHVLRWPVSLLAVTHLLLAALLPGGVNQALGINAGTMLPHLTWLRPVDSLGFASQGGGNGFFVFKIYTESGDVVEGAFPGHEVAPRLRLNRYAMAGDAATGPFPALHERINRYILNHLPSPPLRLELFAARWSWDRDTLSAPWSGIPPQLTMKLHLVGTYNGLTQQWQSTLSLSDQR